ncbi:MAG: methyltransferase domain-containing protein [Nakamurella sp.]
METNGSLNSPDDLAALYRERFDQKELAEKKVLWQTLCDQVFQSYVPADGTVVDLGAGNCEFSNAITARRRVAIDLNPDTKRFADSGVEVILTSSTDMSALGNESVNTVFTSNFFEHLPTKEMLLETLRESYRILLPGGKLVVLMPNMRYLNGRYWDYLDHYLPLTHLSLVEAMELTRFTPERVVPRFLPYTVRNSRLPISRPLISLYLKLKIVWPILGRQMLVVASK